MARILGGIAVSHTPTIGFAVDHHKQQDAAWAPIFQSFEPRSAGLMRKPDALVYIFNDHVTAFSSTTTRRLRSGLITNTMWQTKGWPARSAAGERRCGALRAYWREPDGGRV
ncbi:hypothetical protein DMB90_23605 [Raoultella planticola]|uniref:Protocatechuate 4,5-dioxygenase n=1 Tax=Raoultella planticola TaxID=575 RepID=A0A5P6ABA5_RAOPL|nr:hypothetical protein DMB90_23605 [Raoultella planticola]